MQRGTRLRVAQKLALAASIVMPNVWPFDCLQWEIRDLVMGFRLHYTRPTDTSFEMEETPSNFR
jgi:hypothetical protein